MGKVRAVVEREGWRRGLGNVSGKLFKLIRSFCRWQGGDIVFIAAGLGDAALYRTDHIAEELNFYGFRAVVLYKDDPFLTQKIKRFKIVIFHRVTEDGKVKKILSQLKKRRQVFIYDTDDLVFDLKLFKQTDAYKNFNDWQKKQYEKSVGLGILKNKELAGITTPTSFLAGKLKRFGKPVFVVKNKLSQQDLEWSWQARKIYLKRAEGATKEVRLGYFSGSITHNRDFATIIPALMSVLSERKNVFLYLVGYLDLVDDEFYSRFAGQIRRLPFVSRRKHFQNIAQVDINLAPLEMNDYCQAKSELKFVEAGVVGVPTVAVRNQTFSEAINDGETGLLASSTEEWREKLQKLISDKEYRRTVGENARQLVLKKYLTTSGDNRDYYRFLEKHL